MQQTLQEVPPPENQGGTFILRAVIFANGEIHDQLTARQAIEPHDLLIAADGGTRNCLALGFTPDVIIGDLDSIDPGQRSALEPGHTKFRLFPRDKDQTDLELALSYAVGLNADEILLLGLLGGRLDQTLANLLLLSRSEWKSARLVVVEGPEIAYIVHEHSELTVQGETGQIVSLLPLSPQVTGVTTQNLRWALSKSTLQFGSTLSISNQLTASTALIKIEIGILLVVHRMEINS